MRRQGSQTDRPRIGNPESLAGCSGCENEANTLFVRSHKKLQRTLIYPQIVWFTGLSGAGKTTLCRALAEELTHCGYPNQILDGDDLRKTLCADLGYTEADRIENVRRISSVAGLIAQSGVVVLVAAISPLRAMREAARQAAPHFCEVFVDAPLSTCEARDIKGLYKQARAGHIANFTGIDSPYEAPVAPEVICRTNLETVEESTAKVLQKVLEQLSRKEKTLSPGD